MKTQIDDVESSRAELLTLIGDLTGKMSERFREQFDRINTIFGQTFSELFGGGKAELILENPLDVLECAIEIKVQPRARMFRISTCSRAAKRDLRQSRCCSLSSRSLPRRSASSTRSKRRLMMSTSRATRSMPAA